MTQVRQAVLARLNQYRTPDGDLVVHYESDVLVKYSPGTPRAWKYSELRTTINGNDVQQEALLDQPMRSARPSHLINCEGICDAAFHELPDGVNCACYQLALKFKRDRADITAEMMKLWAEMYEDIEFFVSPRMMLALCKQNDYSC